MNESQTLLNLLLRLQSYFANEGRPFEVTHEARERRGLAGTSPGQHQHRPFGGQHRLALGRVEGRRIGGNLRVFGRIRRGGKIVHGMGNS